MNELKARPLGDRLLVDPIEGKETKTTGGIILTDTLKTHSEGVVVSVGNGLFTQTGDRIPMTVEVGDTVFYHPNTGTPIDLDNKKYRMFRESDLLMVVKK